jgi:hypothetical protein
MAKKEIAVMRIVELLKTLKEVIHDKQILEAARRHKNAFVRERKMPFSSALAFMLDMRKTTIQTRLNIYFENNREEEAMSQQAFSKLRSKFDHTPFVAMHRAVVGEEYSGRHVLPYWNGYHLLSVDGSFLQLPRTRELYEEFSVHGSPEQCPNAGVSVLFDVLHGWSLDAVITTGKMNERTECENHMKFLEAQLPHIAKRSIILLDRGYPSKELFKTIESAGAKFIARCKSNYCTETKEAPMGDSIILLKGSLKARVFKFTLPSGEVETLLTNLFETSAAEFPELYSLRWGIETAYFRFKRELCVEKFSGKSPNSIRQDFWAGMVLMNSVAVFQREADGEVNKRQEGKDKKHENRARTSDLIITLRDRFIFAVLCDRPMFSEVEIERIIKTMARTVSPVRPGRSFPRKHRPFLVANANLKSHL